MPSSVPAIVALLPLAADAGSNVSATSGRAGTTRYWDCSGGACGFVNPADAISCPNNACAFPWGEPKCSPHDWAPQWMEFQGESVLVAAAAASDLLYCGQGSGCAGWGDGSGCGKCYLLTNPGECSSGSPKLQKMIVRVSNLCPGQYNTVCNNQNHFDISAPGFDYSGTSTSNVCTNGGANCDPSVYGSDACANGPIDECDCSRVSSDQRLVDGCNNFKMLGWDNCHVDFEEVACPTNPLPPSPPTPTPPAPSPTPGPTPPQPAQCVEHVGQNNGGTNLKGSTASSSSECCNQCTAEQPACVGYTFIPSNGECWLKSTLGELVHDDNVVSGSVTPTPTPPPPSPTPVPPAPTPGDCPGGSLGACIALCPTDPSSVYQVCVTTCLDRCSGNAIV